MLLGMQRTQQLTIDRSGKGDGRPGKENHDSGWQRLATGDGSRRRKCQQSATRVAGRQSATRVEGAGGKEGDGSNSNGESKKGGG